LKAKRSGIVVTAADVPLVLGMINRGDRKHDVAAWFGFNPARVREISKGDHGAAAPASANQLPPSGSPGPKASAIRNSVGRVEGLLTTGGAGDVAKALQELKSAIARFDRME